MSAPGPESRVGLFARFSGEVQGVGFRFTVCRLAADRPVDGWVRNTPEGAVELRAEGSRIELEGLLAEIRVSPVGSGIAGEDIAWEPPRGLPPGFHVRV